MDSKEVFEYLHREDKFENDTFLNMRGTGIDARNPDTLEFITTAFQKALLGDFATITAGNGQVFVLSTLEEFDRTIQEWKDKVAELEGNNGTKKI